MATIEAIHFPLFLSNLTADNTMRVNVKLSPAGSVSIPVALPDKFLETILGIAQAAADLHEQKMKAEILAAEYPSASDKVSP